MTDTPEAIAAAAAGPKPWYDGKVTDPDLIGHIQTKGWDKDPTEAAVNAIKAHREAERLIGVPANEVLRIPKAGAPEAEMKAYWQKLGAGVEAKDYDLSAVKRADGKPLEGPLADAIKASAATNLVPKDKVLAFAQDIVKHLDGVETEAAAVKAATLTTQKTALAENWGVKADANLFIAKQAAAKLGIDPAAVAALEGVVGYDKVMEMFRTIGTKIGEDRFVSFEGPAGSHIMSKEQAQARVNELKADKVWSTAYMSGDSAKRREMDALMVLIAS